jgi:GNAT superfamily N-acetyltransferase
VDPAPSFPRFSGTADVSVRPGRPEDADAVARVQVVTWRAAFRSLLPAAVLDGWDDGTAAESWRAAIAAPPTPGHGVLVAVERAEVVGFAAYGPAELTSAERPHPSGPSLEVATLLVEPRWGRRGHGSRLLAAVVDLARTTGVSRLQSWLAESDRVSAEFLESAGWAPDGWARTLDTGGTPLREVRWHTLLDNDAKTDVGEGTR